MPPPSPLVPAAVLPILQTAPAYRLLVGSLNVWNPGGAGREDGLARLMRQAEIVLLQELYSDAGLADLCRRSGHPYFARVGDIGIASRHPFTDFIGHQVKRTPSLTPPSQWFRWKYTPFCYARLELYGKVHHVFSNHWDNRQQGNRMRALDGVLRVLATLPKDDVVIFGGDFNAHPEHREIQVLSQLGLKDSFADLPGADHCGTRVDYIFHRGLSSSRYEARCHEEPVPTDHPYVFVELTG